MKKTFILLFALLVCSMSEAAVNTGSCGSGLTWSVDPDANPCVLTISGNGAMNDYAPNAVPWADFRGYIQEVSLPAGLTRLGRSALCDCTQLTSVNVPSGVLSIGQEAFSGCTQLASVSIPSTVTEIGDRAFSECTSLTSLALPAASIGRSVCSSCTALTSVSFTQGTTAIGDSAFLYCSNLTSVSLPNSLTSIGQLAFSHCIRLATASFGTSVATIGTRAFYSCDALRSVSLPNSLTSLGEEAFRSCDALSSVSIGNGLTEVPTRAFFDCGNLATLQLGSGITAIRLQAFSGANISSLVIPDAVNTIEAKAFSNCPSLASVSFGTGLATLNYQAFADCPSLSSISVAEGNSLYDSRDYCNGVVRKSDGALVLGCGGTTFSALIRSIAENAFYHATSVSSITLPNTIEKLESYAFAYCSNLTSISLPDDMWTLPEYAFYSCGQLRNVHLGNDLTWIRDGAFAYCTNLASISIPASVMSIGMQAFVGCPSLMTFKLKRATPPNLNEYSLDEVNMQATVIVPCGATAAYRAAYGWSGFSNISDGFVYDLNVGPSVEGDGTVEITQQPDCSNSTAVITATPAEGCSFQSWSDGNTDNPRTIQVSGDVNLSAVFDRPWCRLTLTVNDPSLGSVTGAGDYQYGVTPVCIAYAYDNSEFVRWSDGSTEWDYRFTIVRDTELQAIFRLKGSDVDDLDADAPARKIFRDGRILIRRDGRLYDTLGRIVE